MGDDAVDQCLRVGGQGFAEAGEDVALADGPAFVELLDDEVHRPDVSRRCRFGNDADTDTGFVSGKAGQESCHGALCHYITTSEAKHFQPMNVNFGILPPVEIRDANGRRIRDKKQKKQLLAEKALAAIEAFKPQIFGC